MGWLACFESVFSPSFNDKRASRSVASWRVNITRSFLFTPRKYTPIRSYQWNFSAGMTLKIRRRAPDRICGGREQGRGGKYPGGPQPFYFERHSGGEIPLV